jgi:hypothetical protein
MKTGVITIILVGLTFALRGEDMPIPRESIVATTGNGTWSWTLTSRLCQMLSTAESWYGSQSPGYTLAGWELTTESQPNITLRPRPNSQTNIIIQLTTNCFAFPLRAEFQMSHEVIHALSPRKRGTSSTLEEGIAVHFSIEYCRSLGSPPMIGNARYESAYSLVVKMLQTHTNAVASLRDLRKQYGSFSSVPADALEKAFPQMTHAEIQILTSKW